MFHLNACVLYSIRKSKRKICSLCYNNGPWLNAMLIRDFNNCNNNTRIFLLPCLLLLILWLLVEVKIETNPFKVFLGTHFRHRTVSDPADFSCVHLFYIFWSLNTSYLDFWIFVRYLHIRFYSINCFHPIIVPHWYSLKHVTLYD